ncbi:MAG: hypothetical protein K9G59_13710 [Caulobacter sp.]|nr:hypothetical protein [Caulobacter sp.]
MEIGSTALFSWVGGAGDLTGRSLAKLSGEVLHPAPDDTPMIRKVRAAWATPLEALSCDQARLLLGQDMGLAWLARPICSLVRKAPTAEVTHYPGDLALGAFRQFERLFVADPIAATAMLDTGDDWMSVAFAFDDELLEDGKFLFAKARALAGLS